MNEPLKKNAMDNEKLQILWQIRKSLSIEKDAIDKLIQDVGDSAVVAVQLLFACQGRVILTGMGKAGLIARKIAATFSSTGTSSFFLHPSEAFHGDLGVVGASDIVIALSNSGETEEMNRLLPHFKRFSVKIISMTSNVDSTLAKNSDVVILIKVEKEADPLGIAPTASTTAVLAMGDALASALLLKRGFTKDQFAIFHPGGTLGKKLLWQVKDLMHVGESIPKVTGDKTLRETISEMTLATKDFKGASFVVNQSGLLEGIFTDGDLRRLLQKDENPLEHAIRDIMIRSPKTIHEDQLAAEAMRIFEDHSIMVLPVTDGAGRLVGALHIHDLVKAGLA